MTYITSISELPSGQDMWRLIFVRLMMESHCLIGHGRGLFQQVYYLQSGSTQLKRKISSSYNDAVVYNKQYFHFLFLDRASELKVYVKYYANTKLTRLELNSMYTFVKKYRQRIFKQWICRNVPIIRSSLNLKKIRDLC